MRKQEGQGAGRHFLVMQHMADQRGAISGDLGAGEIIWQADGFQMRGDARGIGQTFLSKDVALDDVAAFLDQDRAAAL